MVGNNGNFLQVMELDHTFLNSPLCNYFIDVTQSCIENFVKECAVDPSSIEALECYLIGKTTFNNFYPAPPPPPVPHLCTFKLY